MKTPTLVIIFTFISLALGAFPCTKYVIDFEGKAMPGKLKISWSINTGFNNCGALGGVVVQVKILDRAFRGCSVK